MPPVNNNQQTPQYPPTSPQALPSQQKGEGHKGLIVSVLLGLSLFFSLVFGFWAFAQMQDYKNNSDEKAAAAVKVAEDAQAKKLAAEFAEKEKSPYKVYTTPVEFGAAKIVYPKTWGAYVDENLTGGSPVNGYFHPGFVPKVTGNVPFAIRVQVNSTSYANAIKSYEGAVKSGAVKASPVTIEQVKGVVGMRFEGKIDSKNNGSVVIFPLRDKTLKIWTESTGNIGDLNNIVLKNLTFVP